MKVLALLCVHGPGLQLVCRRVSNQSARRGQDGFTLIEVVAACAVLSALVLCTIRAWSAFDQLSYDNLLRQKTVFVLNGEMERLARMWNTSTFATSATSSSGYPAVAGVTNATNRYVYQGSGQQVGNQQQSGGNSAEASSFVTSSIATFQASDTAVLLIGTIPPANYVWIDRGRRVMANLSWASCPVTTNLPTDCWGQTGKAGTASSCWSGTGTTPCQLATLILVYPYLLQNGVIVAGSKLNTVTLSTILGRRA